MEYDKRPAPLTLYYTDPLPDAGFPQIVLTDDGNLMITGGINYNCVIGGSLGNDNYSPMASVYLLHVSGQRQEAAEGSKSLWLWLAIAAMVLTAALHLIILYRRRKPADMDTAVAEPTQEAAEAAEQEEEAEDSDKTDGWTELMSQIRQVMEQEKLYLDSELKLGDVATRLNTNRNAVSACINSQLGCSFSQFIGNCRVEHSKELMRQDPEMKMMEVWMQSGFATESSFFRAFKAATGKTPAEWKAEND